MVTQAAIKLLAAEYREFGCADNAEGLLESGPHGPTEEASVRAIAKALASSGVMELREALEDAFEFLGGVDDASEIRDRILKSLSEQG